MRRPTKRELERFRAACRTLDELARAGFELYVSPGNVHLMTGPSHDATPRANALRENIAETASVRGIGGGDW